MRQTFILGSARCGSTLVSRMLALHPQVLSLSEVFATAGPAAFPHGQISGARFWRGLSTPTRVGSMVGNPRVAPQEFLYQGGAYDPYNCPPLLQITLPQLTDDPDALFQRLGRDVPRYPRADIGTHYTRLFGDLARGFDRTAWVERSGGSLLAAGTLRAMFPQARFVLLARDGVDTVLSMAGYPATRLAVFMWRRLQHLGLDLMHPSGHYGRGRIWPLVQAMGGAFPLQRILDTPPDPVDVAAFWSQMMVRGTSAVQDLPQDRVMVLRYEALLDAPDGPLAQLGTFIAGDAPAGWRAEAAHLIRRGGSKRVALAPETLAKIKAACADGEAALANFRQS
ncbi:sulfotransferase [Ketogulonicigenium vulgare]|uniref:sulfotransferase n=1 Tax=Ketogulonicigenium vulgare TaxID=92945 RepID=UPI0023595775|nr:sulfotransferase [Ketogulonicigenium vulgare]